MTKEQAIKELRVSECYDVMPSVEALDMAINALEQQPSEDCVSRKAVLNTLFYKSDNNCEVVLNKELQDRIKALPPVIPARKSGLCWIERFDNESMWLECPHCHSDSIAAYNYCPNCGASFKEEKRGNENEIN